MAHQVTTDQVLKVTAGLFLGFLAWQGDRIYTRVDTLDTRIQALEVSQAAIRTRLGMPQAAKDTLETGVKTGVCGAAERIKEIKPPEDTPKNSGFYP